MKRSSFFSMLRGKKRKMSFSVRPSTIPGAGKGLFSLRDFKRGDRLLSYRFVDGESGKEVETLDRAQFAARYPPSLPLPTHVLWDTMRGVFLDASKEGLAGKINTRPGNQNCRFTNSARVVATRRIREGEELFVSYGRGFKL